MIPFVNNGLRWVKDFHTGDVLSPGRGYDRNDWLDAEEIVLVKHAGQDIEEPEEEEDEHFFEGVALGMRKETFAPRKAGAEETEETYVNEEMS